MTLFARRAGLVRLIAKGVRRSTKSRPAVGLDLLELGDVEFAPARGDAGLGTLAEWRQSDSFLPLRTDLPRLLSGLYAAELTAATTQEHDPHPELFESLVAHLLALSSTAPDQPLDPIAAAVRFQAALLKSIGYAPQLRECVDCGRKRSRETRRGSARTPAACSAARANPATPKSTPSTRGCWTARAAQRPRSNGSPCWIITSATSPAGRSNPPPPCAAHWRYATPFYNHAVPFVPFRVERPGGRPPSMADRESIPICVPVFPLPDVVLFPRQVLPLHIFEPRYRAMTEEALAGPRAVAIALLRPGFEARYFTPEAPIHHTVGVGRIVAAERLEDGKFNMLLRGEGRAAIVREHAGRPFRVAEIRPLETCCSISDAEVQALRCRLSETISCADPCVLPSRDAFLKLFNAELSLGGLVDLLASSAPIAGEIRQALLDELDDAARAKRLIESLGVLNAVSRVHRAAGRLDCASHN